MKKASNVMYLLTLIFGLLTFIAYIVIATVGLTGAFPPEVIAEIKKVYTGIDVNVFWYALICEAVLVAIAIVFAMFAKKQVNNANNKSISLQIVAIVFGVATGGLFPLLGGIFGIVAIKNEQ